MPVIFHICGWNTSFHPIKNILILSPILSLALFNIKKNNLYKDCFKMHLPSFIVCVLHKTQKSSFSHSLFPEMPHGLTWFPSYKDYRRMPRLRTSCFPLVVPSLRMFIRIECLFGLLSGWLPKWADLFSTHWSEVLEPTRSGKVGWVKSPRILL